MLSMTRRPAAGSPSTGDGAARGVGPSAGSAAASGSLARHVKAFDGSDRLAEARRGHVRRATRLRGYSLLAVALSAFVVALAAANTARVKVNWLFASSLVSLIWLVLAAAVLGWMLGLVTYAALQRRNRALGESRSPYNEKI
jgi:uncharacterized integral membrane protein